MKNYLEEYFPILFPLKEKPHIASMCEYETSNINDKGALEVEVGGFWRDAFRWLTIDGFHYYFPGLIRNTLVDLDSSLCVIEQNWADLVESNEYRKIFSIDEKWNGFSLSQLEYLVIWNKWILKNHPYYLAEDYVVHAQAKLFERLLRLKNEG